jgi:hypothetical protein
MKFEILHLMGGLLIFLGTWFMIASYEEHTKKGPLSNFFLWASTIAYISGAILLSMEVI